MDIFRASGIILMVMGHVGFGHAFDKFIHAFHMPMFFFISGFFYQKKDIELTLIIRKKAKGLLIPYISFGLAHYVISLKNDVSIKPLLHILTINTTGMPIAGALWFLTALFFTDIIYFILDKYNQKRLIIPLVLIGSFADQALPYPLPWALSASFVGLGLYWIGNYVRKNEEAFYEILNLKSWKLLITSAFAAALIFVNGYINMRSGTYAFWPLFWINAILSCCIGISISKLVEKSEFRWGIKKLTSVGENSIVYVCLNQIVISVVKKLVPFNSKLLCQTVVLISSMICLYGLSLLFTRTRLLFFIGKK